MSIPPIDLSYHPQAVYLPFDWYVMNETYTSCPTQASILITFAAINVAVSLLSLVFGHEKVIRLFTPRCLQSKSHQMWGVTCLVPLGIQLAANALVAYIYKTQPGYGQGFAIHDLTLFFITRPRLSWFFLAVLMPLGRYGGADDKLGYYETAAKRAVLAEVFLLLIGSYTMGLTANFAASRGYYSIGALDGPYAHDAYMMYAGALLYLIALLFALIGLVVLLLARLRYVVLTSILVIISIASLVGSWLFWAGYVRLAGDL